MLRATMPRWVMLLIISVAVGGTGCGDEGTDPTYCVEDEEGNPVPLAPDSARVDTYTPAFTDPTDVTNPLFPIRNVHSALLLGTEDGEPLRVEVTLLPQVKTIDVDGQPVETLESQYVAFIDGRLAEVALDWYGQDDLGAVWYFGEDVFNYEEGILADREGTWEAGIEGPPAMIMPAGPQVGDVYRPENICGLVFEEVTVLTVGQTVNGPTGPVPGAITVEELHQDATHEDKTFAPGYGEFSTGAGANLEAVALAVPTDALAAPTPAALVTIVDGADDVFAATAAADWNAVETAQTQITTAWNGYRAGAVPLLRTQMDAALAGLTQAVITQIPADVREASIDVARLAFDLELRYRLPAEIDIARFELWARQILVDTEEVDPDAVKGDVTTLNWIRARFVHTLEASTVAQIDGLLADLQDAADGEDLDAAATAAQELRDLIAGL